MNEDRAQCAAPEDSGKEVRIESTGGDRRWAMVPLEILGMGLTGREYDLFTAMSLCAGRPSGLCAAGERHLAEMIGRSRRVVRDVLPKLAERGLIRDTGRKGPHGVTVWSVKPFPPEVSAGASRDARYLEPTSEPAGAFRTSSGRVPKHETCTSEVQNIKENLGARRRKEWKTTKNNCQSEATSLCTSTIGRSRGAAS